MWLLDWFRMTIDNLNSIGVKLSRDDQSTNLIYVTNAVN